MLDALIVGGGVAGLEAALTLKANGLSVRLLEASERVGGAVSTRLRSGFRAELGASTVRADGALLQARCRDFDLPLQRVGAGSARRKGVLTSAGLTYLAGPGDLMRSRLLSVKGKLRALAEPLQRAGDDPDESLRSFMERRLGAEAGGLVAPLMARGVYAAPAEQLAVRTAFPRIWSMERRGGLIRSLAKTASPGIASLPGGLGALARGYAERLASEVVTGARVRSVERDGLRWVVDDGERSWEARQLVLALPSTVAASLLRALDEPLGEAVAAIRTSPLTSVQVAYGQQELPDAFGFLAHPSAGGETLGCVFASRLDPSCAPRGAALLTCLVGASSDPAASACAAVERALGWRTAPEHIWMTPYPDGLPRYDAEQDRLRPVIEQRTAALSGLQLAGNYLHGISVEGALQSGRRAAEQVLRSQAERKVA